MPKLETKLNIRSPEFVTNTKLMQSLVDDLRSKIDKISLGGGVAASKKHTDRDKLLPRDRVQLLLDPGTPFLEFSHCLLYTSPSPRD